MTDHASARAALDAILGCEAWSVIRRGDAAEAVLVGGERTVVESLLDVPLETGTPAGGAKLDRLLAVPFRQVRERGFDAIDDETPLVVVTLSEEHHLSVDDLLAVLPDVPLDFTDPGGFEVDDASYIKLVEQVIAEEIGRGEGANLVVARNYRAKLADWGADQALTVLRRLLERERGAYWTYVFHTGDRILVGASPERHVSVIGGDVRMNPISGTYHLPKQAQPAERTKAELLEFLSDEKEIYELFMVVDEELKMMCEICNEGGQVLGPFLKPMTHLVHTEYLLAGRTKRDIREVLRDTMYAATLTGSPVENACKLIAEYEPEGRAYYGAALALIGRGADGSPMLDSPIVIRSADVSLDGELRVVAGATLVRDSDPATEVRETHAKAGGILSAFGLVPPAAAPAGSLGELARDEDVLIALNQRNQRLSTFWLTNQAETTPDGALRGKSAVILDGEDDFVNMLRHVLSVLGMTSRTVRHEDWRPGALDGADLVIVGPGPGDPRDGADPKIQRIRAAVDELLAAGRPTLAVCLGHQTLCERLGLPLAFKDIVFQGTQSPVELPRGTERVGFYNTFVARVDDSTPLPEDVVVWKDEETGDVHQIEGPHYRGIQFHAESVLTEHGFDLIHDLVRDLLVGG
ncbi:anthranilate synthase family protein [Nocardioides alcanivorans]|uniref:anthranilate synthase family protein n=1 Tax=Nocardioides alcanivorans TaxID=2897352 RepID=UPI001F2A337A|nr:anthranilate synthase family protein [Nocardioides alcanivorans]